MRLAALALLASGAFAQTVGVVSAGYAPRPTAVTVAPGQVITISVFGVSAPAAVSATVQSGTLSPIPVPLLSVTQSPCPAASVKCAEVTDISLQIPFEVPPPVPPGSERPTLLSNLVFAENGVAKGFVPLNIVSDRIHIANSCDTTFGSPTAACTPLVTHADGTLVTQAQPAHPGEELVMYAMGLGLTNPVPKSGDKSPLPAAPSQATFSIIFVSAPNAPPINLVGASGRWFDTTGFATKVLFSGLTPGFVGLYQINFQALPYPTMAVVPPCTADGGIASNLTVNALGPASFDGVGICVAF